MSDSWYDVTPLSGNKNGKLTVSAEANFGPDRSATVSVVLANGRSRTFTISQEGLLTIVAEFANPAQRMYVTIQSDELYDYFNQIKRFEITFTDYNFIPDTLILKVTNFSEDGSNVFSDYIDHEKYNLEVKIRFCAARMLSGTTKYIQVAALMEKIE